MELHPLKNRKIKRSGYNSLEDDTQKPCSSSTDMDKFYKSCGPISSSNSNVKTNIEKNEKKEPVFNEVTTTCTCSECNVTPNSEHEDDKNGCCASCKRCCCRQTHYSARMVHLGTVNKSIYSVPNVIRNQKYTVLTFIPAVLIEQFSCFINLLFLVMACTQLYLPLRINYLSTYWGPLCFVVFVTMIREAIDDYYRAKRDKEVNSARYSKLTAAGRHHIASSEIKLGDLLVLEKDQRIPADMILLRTTERQGACFIRTDQLDGETDWKLRVAVANTQSLDTDIDLFNIQAQIYAERPNRSINDFQGTYSRTDGSRVEESLTAENTLWSSTVLASGTAVGIVIYTGRETRACMNSSQAHSKFGKLDQEVNNIAKIIFLIIIILSVTMVALKGFHGQWYKYLWRFCLLFSYMIPLALRVSLDMAKLVTAYILHHDKEMPGVIVRSTTIPEELGRVSYLLSDKTGTLTKNEMVFKKLHLGSVAFGQDTIDEVTDTIHSQFSAAPSRSSVIGGGSRGSIGVRLVEAVRALAICHNVTPVLEDSRSPAEARTQPGGVQGAANTLLEAAGARVNRAVDLSDAEEDLPEADQTVPRSGGTVTDFQSSSPDEVALVRWTQSVGVVLAYRDLYTIKIRAPNGNLIDYEILQMFPFTSESKRMGIIVKSVATGELTFYMKGADCVMSSIVAYTDWMEEESINMAREGLRTLVVASKTLSAEEYAEFAERLHQAKMAMSERTARVAACVATLERGLDLLCVTGVEDMLQDNVRPTLEILRNAGIRIWMLTGDKQETAECIAKSSRLVAINQQLHTFQKITSRSEAHLELNSYRRHVDAALLISGEALQICLQYYEHEFVELACQAPSVLVYRCSPTQKSSIVELLQRHTGLITAAIGDGGNDVGMIQLASVGIGLEGKEGRQASMASDFSLTQFSHLNRLLLVHGRRFYKNSSTLSQFVIHRGVSISVMQAVFSALFYGVAVPLFPGYLMVGYATIFTSFPIFALVLDRDVKDQVALTYPELYRELIKGREVNFKTFFIWILISIYQGSVIMYGSLFLFESDFIHVVAITFTSLVLTELILVALTIQSWHPLMLLGEFLSLLSYLIALIILKDFFDPEFITSVSFLWKTTVVTCVSCIPIVILKFVKVMFRPSIYSKLQ